MAFRSERTLYKRICDLCKKQIIAAFPPEAAFPVYCEACWWSDKWDGESFAREYDSNRSFWLQFRALQTKVPRLALFGMQNENCPYSNYTWVCKSCYLSPSTLYSENIMHSAFMDRSRDCLDCMLLGNSELCYEVVQGEKNYRCLFSTRIYDSADCWFLFDCRNCQNCFMSANLRGKQYVFEGKQCTPDEYEEKLARYNLKDAIVLNALREKFMRLAEGALHKYANVVKSTDAAGDNIINSRNVYRSYDVRESENVRYSERLLSMKDSVDVNNAGPTCELFYEGMNVGLNDAQYLFTVDSWEGGLDVEYSDLCVTCSHVFGCVGLRKKEYSILNKRYPKETYEALVPKIREHMSREPYIDRRGRTYRYGEFFPAEFASFPHNTTLAHEYFPMTKEETKQEGYEWRTPEERHYKVTVAGDELPTTIEKVPDSITGDVIGCAHAGTCLHQCTTAFKVIPEELQFYRRLGLPIPALCPNCRHAARLARRNPLKLWRRRCMCDRPNHQHGADRCPAEFETSYSPDRKETVYCEQCYNAEVV
jgi:hypothetical protein